MNGLDSLVLLAVVVGVIGVVVPVLPGLLLVYGAVALWGVLQHDVEGWVVVAVATVLLALGQVAKYLLPGRRLRSAGVPWSTMLAGTVLGIVGFFVVPVVGLLLGFVLGVYLAELLRTRDHSVAWPSTVHALKAAGWSMLIELAAALLIAATWAAALAV